MQYYLKGIFMNKILKFSLVSVLSTFVLVGCSGTPDAPDSEESHNAQMSSVEAHAIELHGHFTQKKLSTLVKNAGESAGWKMTEFKSDTFVAEKTNGEDTESVTVKFNKELIEVEPENNDLQDAINKALGR